MTVSSLTGATAAAAAQQAQYAAKPAPTPQQNTSASTQDRTTAQDTVSISAAGQQAAKASGDVDHDGDSK